MTEDEAYKVHFLLTVKLHAACSQGLFAKIPSHNRGCDFRGVRNARAARTAGTEPMEMGGTGVPWAKRQKDKGRKGPLCPCPFAAFTV